MNRQQSAEKCYGDIMELQGADALKKTVRRLRNFQQNKDIYSVPDVTLPNYLWTIRRGGGVSSSVNAFAEYLYAAKIINFTGIVKYFEFIPAYTAPDAHFSELTRLNNTISEIAGHYRFFRGIACIIIDEWLDHTGEAHFLNIFDYIANHNDKILAVFCVHTDNKRSIAQVEAAIASYMRVETVHFKFPCADELVEFIERKYFSPGNFVLTQDAKSLLAESLAEIIPGRNFNGFVTVKQLANDILYSLLTTKLGGIKISAKMLSGFGRDSEYIKRIKSTVANESVIGFSAREEG